MVTAAALGDALGIPVHGVCSLDAIAHGLGAVVVVTDARRREVYWAAYDDDGRRTHGPHVDAPAVLVERLPDVPAAAGGPAPRSPACPWSARPRRPPSASSPSPPTRSAGGVVPGPLEPLYLRRPDAQEPGARKRVTV